MDKKGQILNSKILVFIFGGAILGFMVSNNFIGAIIGGVVGGAISFST